MRLGLPAATSLLVSLLLPTNVEAAGLCFMLYQFGNNEDSEWFVEGVDALKDSGLVKDSDVTTFVFQALPDGVAYRRYMANSKAFSTKNVGKRDAEDPEEIKNFVQWAMDKCIKEDNRDDFFLGFSALGLGQTGLGNTDSRRRLKVDNSKIAGAIYDALDAVENGPNRLDVIGFEVNSMCGCEAVDEYEGLADYYLASETSLPSHGWFYNYLTNGDSAVKLGEDIINTFVSRSIDGVNHATPKLMAMVDTDKFSTFMNAWDDLAKEMRTQLRLDLNFYNYVERARRQVLDFASAMDTDTTFTSNVDIGNFFTVFEELCNPNGDLEQELVNAQTAYNNMFKDRQSGKGSPDGTGMTVFWPLKNSIPQSDVAVGFWATFLKEYLDGTVPSSASSSSSCNNKAVATEDDTILITASEVSKNSKDFVTFTADIGNAYVYTTAGVYVEKDNFARRLLGERALAIPFIEPSDWISVDLVRLNPIYEGNSVTSTWEGDFPSLTDKNGNLYYMNVKSYESYSSGSSTIWYLESDVVYFDKKNSLKESALLEEYKDPSESAKRLGGQLCTIGYTLDGGNLNSDFNLYCDYTDVKKTVGSGFVPLLPVTRYSGKFGNKIQTTYMAISEALDWDPNKELSIAWRTPSEVLDENGLDYVSFNTIANAFVTLDNTVGGTDVTDFVNYFLDSDLNELGQFFPESYGTRLDDNVDDEEDN